MLEVKVVESVIPTKYAVIWLHGLGADANDFVPITQEFQAFPFRFIFPNAPIRAVTINNGYMMRAWYDITGFGFSAREDREGLEETYQQIDQLIQQQVQLGIPYENIFLGGFSQGGASILYTGLRYPQKLAGFIALSAYLPFFKELTHEKHISNLNTPVFWGHGSYDPIVLPEWADASITALNQAGCSHIAFYTYPMAHQVSQDEIVDLKQWFKNKLF